MPGVVRWRRPAPTSPPTSGRDPALWFLARNRVIAAMLGGTVVVEAALRSGMQISVKVTWLLCHQLR